MATSHILIHFKPQLYTDLFVRIFQSLGSVEVYEAHSPILGLVEGGSLPEKVDVVVLSLDANNLPEVKSPADWLPSAKLIAFSPAGDLGYRRLPGEDAWEEIRPYGLYQLVRDVMESESL